MPHANVRQRAAEGPRRARRGAAPPSAQAIERTVRAAACGDQRAWSELVGRYSGLVWSVTRSHRLDPADAADVAQAVWLKLVQRIDGLDDPSAVGSWLATTARRECLTVLRRRKRQQPWDELPEARLSDDSAIDARLLASEREALVWEAFVTLPARDQALLRLLATDPPPSYEQIGAALGMPIGSIGPTRGRALARLRCALARLGFDPDARE
jgi:RNA polymerase sigma factor (sigma-70 family)